MDDTDGIDYDLRKRQEKKERSIFNWDRSFCNTSSNIVSSYGNEILMTKLLGVKNPLFKNIKTNGKESAL